MPRPSEKLAQGPYFLLKILVRVPQSSVTVPLLDTEQLVLPQLFLFSLAQWILALVHTPCLWACPTRTLNHGGPSAAGTHTVELSALPDPASSSEGWMVLLWWYVVTYHWETLSGIEWLLLQCSEESNSFQIWKTVLFVEVVLQTLGEAFNVFFHFKISAFAGWHVW